MQTKTVTAAFAALLASSGIAMAEDYAPSALNSYTFVPKRMLTATVAGQDGQVIGIVGKVEADRAGKPEKIEIAMAGGRKIAIRSDEASYDPIANMVITDAMATRIAMAASVQHLAAN